MSLVVESIFDALLPLIGADGCVANSVEYGHQYGSLTVRRGKSELQIMVSAGCDPRSRIGGSVDVLIYIWCCEYTFDAYIDLTDGTQFEAELERAKKAVQRSLELMRDV